MFLTDTHCHLNLNQFNNDLEEVLDRARSAGIGRILVPGIDLETSRKAVELADRYPEVFAAVGIHPNIGGDWHPGVLKALKDLAAHPKVVAIGEIGLDNHWKDTDPLLQQEILLAQLDLAAQVEKPAVLHSREALNDLLPTLNNWSEELRKANSPLTGRAGVLHSYEGELIQAEQARRAGFFISIAGPLTYKNAADKHLLAREHPIENLLIETDAPYLTPHPHRGTRNEPAFVALIAQALSDHRQMEIEQVIEVTTRNASNLFNWSL